MMRPLRLLSLCAIWLLWSGHFEPLLLAFGLGSVLLVCWLSDRLGGEQEGPLHPHRLGLRMLAFLPWLLWEVVKANVAVAAVIVRPQLRIQPQLVRVSVGAKGEHARTLFANAVTLTPGTITLDLRHGEALVHALTTEAAADLQTGELDRRVAALEVQR